MTSEDFKMCEYIYDNVTCPVCGSKITYEPIFTKLHAYKQIGCNCPEVEKIIQQRGDDYIRAHQEQPRTVRLKISPLHADE